MEKSFVPFCFRGSNRGALSIVLMPGLSDIHRRQLLVKAGYPASMINACLAWKESYLKASHYKYFMTSIFFGECDAGDLLWNFLSGQLRQDEAGLKHQVLAVDEVLRSDTEGVLFLPLAKASAVVSRSAAEHRHWHDCEFVALVLVHLTLKLESYSEECEWISSHFPCLKTLRDRPKLELQHLACFRWPYVLQKAFDLAVANAHRTCTVLYVDIVDMELLRKPAIGRENRSRTFAHKFVITVSNSGVYIFQGYGPRGYTLLQFMEENDARFPLTFSQAESWMQRFHQFAGELSGVWTEKVNRAYAYCFDVDLVALGQMRIGSQLDAIVLVEPILCDSESVRYKLSSLPYSGNECARPCRDGVKAKSKAPMPGIAAGGGVPHYYVPRILRCAACGELDSDGNKRCMRCQKVYYCSRECQIKDWRARHKIMCRELAARACEN